MPKSFADGGFALAPLLGVVQEDFGEGHLKFGHDLKPHPLSERSARDGSAAETGVHASKRKEAVAVGGTGGPGSA